MLTKRLPLFALAVLLLAGCSTTPVKNFSTSPRPAILEKSFAQQTPSLWDLAFASAVITPAGTRGLPYDATFKLDPGPQKIAAQYYGHRTTSGPYEPFTLRVAGPIELSATLRPAERYQVRAIVSDADVIFLIADQFSGDILAHSRPIPIYIKDLSPADPYYPFIKKAER